MMFYKILRRYNGTLYSYGNTPLLMSYSETEKNVPEHGKLYVYDYLHNTNRYNNDIVTYETWLCNPYRPVKCSEVISPLEWSTYYYYVKGIDLVMSNDEIYISSLLDNRNVDLAVKTSKGILKVAPPQGTYECEWLTLLERVS